MKPHILLIVLLLFFGCNNAKNEVNDLLRFAKTDNRDPIQTLTEISKKRLRSDKVISTGEELPEVIANVLGKDNNLKNTVLQTVSNYFR